MDVLYLLEQTWMQHLNALVDTSADCQNSYKPSEICIQMWSELDFYRGRGSLMGFIFCCCTVVMHMHLAEASEP